MQDLYDKEKLKNINIYCGTSIGAVISLLLLIDYKPIDIYNVLKEINFEILFDYDIENILDDNYFGVYSSDKIIYIIGMLIKNKSISVHITFRQLYEKINKKIIITGVCLNDISLHLFSYESNPNMEVLTAIRISMSVPIIFKPVKFENKIWIDGGCLNNFPIDLFDDCLENVIGIYLGTNEIENIETFQNVKDYFSQITKCLFKNVFKFNIKKYEKYIIYLNTDKTDWAINKQEKIKLYNFGYNFDKNYL